MININPLNRIPAKPEEIRRKVFCYRICNLVCEVLYLILLIVGFSALQNITYTDDFFAPSKGASTGFFIFLLIADGGGLVINILNLFCNQSITFLHIVCHGFIFIFGIAIMTFTSGTFADRTEEGEEYHSTQMTCFGINVFLAIVSLFFTICTVIKIQSSLMQAQVDQFMNQGYTTNPAVGVGVTAIPVQQPVYVPGQQPVYPPTVQQPMPMYPPNTTPNYALPPQQNYAIPPPQVEPQPQPQPQPQVIPPSVSATGGVSVGVTVPPVNAVPPSVNVTPAQVTVPPVEMTAPSVQMTAPSAQITAPSVQMTAPSAEITAPSAQLNVVPPSINVAPGQANINVTLPSVSFGFGK